ncbi:retrotransposon protein, putative, ty1-copia subclass [Tanacetum coccineum]
MVTSETVTLQNLYWTTYIEYGWSDLRPEVKDGMAAATQNTNNTTIRHEKKIKFMEQPIGLATDPETSDPDTIDKYYELVNLEQEVACLMLSTFHACKQEEGQLVSSYLMKLKIYLDMLERLGYAMPNELGVSLILNSLNKEYDQFVQNYNMHNIGKTLAELHAMLKLYEKGIPKKAKNPAVLAIREGNIQKDKKKKPQGAKGKGRNCPSCHAELKKRKNASVASTSGNFTIELYAFPNKTWVYDTGYETHICITSQGLREIRKLKRRDLSMYMGNGMRAVLEAIRSFDLILPSGLIIVLDNCHFAPTITRGVVLISRLVNNDMHNLYPNVSSNYNVSNKRAKHGLDSYYLCHCRHGHINKKRMDMLQHDGLLQPTHDESHKKCKSCISGKIVHKPFPHQVERAKDLLGLIHTDVCGPFRTVSREGANYFITFTDDFSRYGFVYLMKHKHEVFETFKVFHNEVENQLVTLPYTPQHNRVSEKWNQTLLDMVRSMMNLTTLTKSFWGYALETAARILNMVPTKKADRTPYEIRHGKAPKLSYLRVWGFYPKETMGYYFYYPLENKIFVSLNTEFFENSFMVQEASGSHILLKMSGSDKGLELIQEEDTQPSDNTNEAHNEVAPIKVEPENVRVPIRRSTIIPQVPDRYGYYVDIEEYELGDLDEPPNYKAALAYPESVKWLEAMNTEIQSIRDKQVWYLVDLPSNGRIVGCKWLFKKKTDMDGNVHTFKACLVAKGFTQTYGVDYGETFSPVADIRAIRIL